jgi:hypothetical protein
MQSFPQTLTAVGPTPPIQMVTGEALSLQRSYVPNPLYPQVVVGLSSGASLTYTVEVTGDNTPSATGTWVPLTNGFGLTANSLFTLYGAVQAVRANITSYTSGTLIITLVCP